MNLKNLVVGLVCLASSSAHAVSTVFMPTNQNVNFVFSINSGSSGLELAMFDDANTSFSGMNYLSIDFGDDTVFFSPTIGQPVDYAVTNNSTLLPGSATLYGSDWFILAMRDTTTSSPTWLDPDAVVCSDQSNSCTVSWDDMSTEVVVDVQVVPVPAALWLFGSGLLGLVGIARRRS